MSDSDSAAVEPSSHHQPSDQGSLASPTTPKGTTTKTLVMSSRDVSTTSNSELPEAAQSPIATSPNLGTFTAPNFTSTGRPSSLPALIASMGCDLMSYWKPPPSPNTDPACKFQPLFKPLVLAILEQVKKTLDAKIDEMVEFPIVAKLWKLLSEEFGPTKFHSLEQILGIPYKIQEAVVRITGGYTNYDQIVRYWGQIGLGFGPIDSCFQELVSEHGLLVDHLTGL